MNDLRTNGIKHHIRVYACLSTQYVFLSRADSGFLLTVINVQVSDSTLSINQASKNVARNQTAPSSRVSSAQDDPGKCFNNLHLRWKMLRNHRDTDLYWFFDDDPVSLRKNSGIITEWLLLFLVELEIPTPPGVKWTGHSLRRGGASATHSRHRRVDCTYHDLGLMEFSRFSAPLHRRLCVSVLKSSLLLRPPTYLRSSIFIK
jgi:hypothetical protein